MAAIFEPIFGELWMLPVSGLIFAVVGLTYAYIASKLFDRKWGK